MEYVLRRGRIVPFVAKPKEKSIVFCTPRPGMYVAPTSISKVYGAFRHSSPTKVSPVGRSVRIAGACKYLLRGVWRQAVVPNTLAIACKCSSDAREKARPSLQCTLMFPSPLPHLSLMSFFFFVQGLFARKSPPGNTIVPASGLEEGEPKDGWGFNIHRRGHFGWPFQHVFRTQVTRTEANFAKECQNYNLFMIAILYTRLLMPTLVREIAHC